jgi:hypothetical protein
MGRQDGPDSESGGNVGYGGGSFGGGMGEGQSSVTADTFSSGGRGGGGGRQDGPGGALEEQSYVATGRMSGPGSDAYNAAKDAISRGMNPYATSTQNYIADQLGYRDPTDIPGMFGYDTKKSLGQNIENMVVPGRNTPLGILSAAIPGSDTIKGIVGLANTIAGRMGIGSTTNPATQNQGIASGSTLVGKDSIIGEYTGRPDDAPLGRAQTKAGQFMQDNYTDRTSSAMPSRTQQVADTGITLDDIMNFRPQDITVTIPEMKMAPDRGPAVNDVLDYFGLPRTVDVPTPFGDINVGFPDRKETSFRDSIPQGGIAQTELGQFLQNRAPQNLGPAIDDQLALFNFGAAKDKIEQLSPTLARRGSIYTSNPVGTSRNRGASGFDTTTLEEAAKNAVDFLKSLNPVGNK